MSNFNHVDKNLSKEDIKTIREYYEVCQQSIWVCHTSRKKYMKKNLALRFAGGFLSATAIGTTLSLGPLGTSIFAGVLFCIAFGEKMGWKEKAEKLKIIETEYSNLAEELKTYMRGTEKLDVKFPTRLDYLEKLKNSLAPSMTNTYAKYAKMMEKTYKPDNIRF